MKEERTTKIVTLTVTATFHGDYLGSDEVATYLEGWIDAGLEDRDDLRRWKTDVGTVVEIDGDPEGFDAPDDTSYGCVDGHGNEWPECDYDEIECRRCGAQSND